MIKVKTRILTILLLILSQISLSQGKKQVRIIDSVSNSKKIESLESLYGFNKKIPIKHELPCLIALSYFPELAHSAIIFKESKISTTLNARPTTLSLLFRNKKKRKYIVRINSKQKDSLVTLNDVPFNAKIGLLAHEFNHFIDYSEKNIFGIIKRLFSYSNKKSKERFEKEIDSMTIKRGLGWQLYDWSEYVLNKSDAKLKYKNFKKEIYLEPEEILEIITESKLK